MKVYCNHSAWIIEHHLEDDFVEEIKAFIQDNLDQLIEDTKGYSTTGEEARQYWLINNKRNMFYQHPKFFELINKYTHKILNRIKKAGVLIKDTKDEVNLSPLSSWSVIGEEGSFHTVHDHGGAIDGISSLLYLEVPENNKENEHENNLFLITHVGPKSALIHENCFSLEVNPEVGKLLIFPNWIPHGTYPQTKGIRQTFNVNYELFKNDLSNY